MDKNVIQLILVLLMVVTIVAVDIAFFRHHFWQRLITNVAIVLIFIVLDTLFLKHS